VNGRPSVGDRRVERGRPWFEPAPGEPKVLVAAGAVYNVNPDTPEGQIHLASGRCVTRSGSPAFACKGSAAAYERRSRARGNRPAISRFRPTDT